MFNYKFAFISNDNVCTYNWQVLQVPTSAASLSWEINFHGNRLIYLGSWCAVWNWPFDPWVTVPRDRIANNIALFVLHQGSKSDMDFSLRTADCACSFMRHIDFLKSFISAHPTWRYLLPQVSKLATLLLRVCALLSIHIKLGGFCACCLLFTCVVASYLIT